MKLIRNLLCFSFAILALTSASCKDGDRSLVDLQKELNRRGAPDKIVPLETEFADEIYQYVDASNGGFSSLFIKDGKVVAISYTKGEMEKYFPVSQKRTQEAEENRQKGPFGDFEILPYYSEKNQRWLSCFLSSDGFCILVLQKDSSDALPSVVGSGNLILEINKRQVDPFQIPSEEGMWTVQGEEIVKMKISEAERQEILAAFRASEPGQENAILEGLVLMLSEERK